jgi:hypothetical protein
VVEIDLFRGDANMSIWKKEGYANAILLLMAAIEILVALMGFVPRYAGVFKILAAIAGVIAIAHTVTLFTARLTPASEPGKPNRLCRLSKTQQLLLGLMVAVATCFCLPVWHRHGDFAGQMHGHPIWVDEHVH